MLEKEGGARQGQLIFHPTPPSPSTEGFLRMAHSVVIHMSAEVDVAICWVKQVVE